MEKQQIDITEIGAAILQARLDKGFTQKELAAKCGTTKTVINKIETDAGSVTVATIRNIVEKGLGGQMELCVQV